MCLYKAAAFFCHAKCHIDMSYVVASLNAHMGSTYVTLLPRKIDSSPAIAGSSQNIFELGMMWRGRFEKSAGPHFVYKNIVSWIPLGKHGDHL